MDDTKQTFLIHIAILEGRHYLWQNMDSIVEVTVHKSKKITAIQYGTDSPYYNEYFVFDITTTLKDLLAKFITITVLQVKNCWKKRKILGSITLDIGTVWSEPDHQFFHKWAALLSPSKNAGIGARGFLKVNIGIVYKGVVAVIPEVDNDHEIEGNLLLPHGVFLEQHKACFIISAYHGKRICPDATLEKENESHIYLEIQFAGLKAKTSSKKSYDSPVWNEAIVITHQFPPFCQNVRIDIRYSTLFFNKLHATKFIDIQSLSSDKEKGFLPTFGPSYLHFYNLSQLEGYAGKVLLSIQTELDHSMKIDRGVEVRAADTINKEGLLSTETLYFYGCIMGVSAIDENIIHNTIRIKISFGHELLQKFGHDRFINNLSQEFPVHRSLKNYFYINVEEEKPLLSFAVNQLDFRKKYYNINMIMKITKDLGEKLHDIRKLLKDKIHTARQKVPQLLNETLDFINTSAKKYIDIASGYSNDEGTELDKKRLKFDIIEMGDIARSSITILEIDGVEKKFIKTEKLYYRIKRLLNTVQDSWPDLFLWIVSDNKNVGFLQISAGDVLYSPIEEERGENCGKVTTIFLKQAISKKFIDNWVNQSDYDFCLKRPECVSMVAKVEVILWLGMGRHKEEFLKILPREFSLSEGDIPRSIIITEKHVFQCRVHIFQAHCKLGMDQTALADAFVRICVMGLCKETKIKEQTLDPLWDQMIIFYPISLYGSLPFIKLNPPTLIIELYDQDKLNKTELIGRNIVKPLIKSMNEPYAPPLFPPKLVWTPVFNKTGMKAELLAAYEFLEVTGPLDDLESEDSDLPIPNDIKPKLVNFRMEILFWGMRSLKSLQFLDINKPRLTLRITDKVVESDTLTNARKNPNFYTTIKSLELILPQEIEFASPITITLEDSRFFGMYIYCGTYIEHIKEFLWIPTTEKERELEIMGVSTSEGAMQGKRRQRKFLGKLFRRNKTKQAKQNNSKCIKCMCKEPEWRNFIFNSCDGSCMTETSIWEKFKLMIIHKGTLCICCKRFYEDYEKIESIQDVCNCCSCTKKQIKDEIKPKREFCKCCKNVISVFKCRKERNRCKCCENIRQKMSKILIACNKCFFCRNLYKLLHKPKETEHIDTKDFDWWTKFYASVEEASGKNTEPYKNKLKIYFEELEKQPEFNEFADMLKKFPIYRGKDIDSKGLDEKYAVGVFKGSIKVYMWPEQNINYVTPNGLPLEKGIFQQFPTNGILDFVVRVYCVRALNLVPRDTNGKCDPYLHIHLNDKEIIDKDNCKLKQTSPVFGRCFEFFGSFPHDNILVIGVWDWDMTTCDDIIGETSIDLENRLYTRHRASCGIPNVYEEKGYCKWRDQEKPTAILTKMCKQWNLPEPIYSAMSVKIGHKEFEPNAFTSTNNIDFDKEVIALSALRRWKEVPTIDFELVPEHVETRSLYKKNSPGIEQGKIQLWIDIFPRGNLPQPHLVDISPGKPVKYELRVIIWNVADVILSEDEFISGEKKSDIYVKGILEGYPDAQYTDVHYRSVSGEGYFNWRFIFHFNYLSAENKAVIQQKSLFSYGEAEVLIPCRLILQIWDNDTFSSDDFLGSVTLELSKLIRGAKNHKQCSLQLLDKGPYINLFKIKRTKGWWPFKGNEKKTQGKPSITGKLEAEFELLTEEESRKTPAGMARNGPEALPVPKRPDFSFFWLKNPYKALKYIICKTYKWTIIKIIFFFLFISILLYTIYNLPGLVIKKYLGLG